MSEDKTSLNAEFMVTETDPELAVLQVLANYKWATGFVCRKCGHDHYCAGKKPYSRRCTKCKTEKSATAHTVFHRCRIPLTEAVKLAETVCKQPDISTYEISRIFEKRQMTCWKFKTRIMECLTDKSKADLLKHLIAAIN